VATKSKSHYPNEYTTVRYVLPSV